MKTDSNRWKSKSFSAAVCALYFTLSLCVQAQSNAINWFEVSGGGGTSTNGGYSLSGTIGQADAGTLSGGGFTLEGGFWSGAVALQTPGAPTLTIQVVGSSVILSWPLTADGWALRESPALAGTGVSWNLSPQACTTNANTISVTVPAPGGVKFYRLQKP
ncbi:MAG: hypothetical protein MUC65_01825 [Pontiellaceae bacterium]|nr:hypothetical protein [Pontiellaceae bacterium]